MRLGFREILEHASSRQAAVGAFTCYNLEATLGVLRAAEQANAPVVLLVAESSFSAPAGEALMRAIVATAETAPVPAIVQLDHVGDLAVAARALAAGARAVMADGSRLPFEENVTFSEAAVSLARTHLADVEVELGHIEGNEDVAVAVAAGELSDPDQAKALVERTMPSCLAVSIGNVHGHYARPPQLDWARLAKIREHVDVPLSLHGASGIDNATLRRAIREGVCKVNVNTELRAAYFEATANELKASRQGLNVAGLNAAQRDATAAIVNRKLEVFGWT